MLLVNRQLQDYERLMILTAAHVCQQQGPIDHRQVRQGYFARTRREAIIAIIGTASATLAEQ